MAESPNTSSMTTSSPDWATISHEVVCPLCEYNLRGLNTPRCPECGYGFEWSEVLDARRDLHPYLFEHHPEQNLKSFCLTAAALWRPERFWSSLHPAQKSRPGRLIFFWLLGGSLLAVISCALVIVPAQIMANERNTRRDESRKYILKDPDMSRAIVSKFGSIDAYLDQWNPHQTAWDLLKNNSVVGSSFFRLPFMIPQALIVPLLWPWLTCLALMVFQISMRRARIRNIHIIRCVLYAFDPVSWVIIFIVGGALLAFTDKNWDSNFLLLIDLGVLVGSYRLWKAYQLYLRFDRPFWTVVACQVIAVLGILTLTALIDLRLFYRQIVDNPLFWLFIE